MAPQVVLPRDFDIKNVSFSDVKVLDNGGKIVYVSYNRAPLIVQTPTMSAPFGMSRWDGDGGAANKYTLDLSFKGMDASPSMRAFHDLLENLDSRMVDDGFANQQTWFKGKKYNSREIVEALYTPLIKFAKDKRTGERTDAYPPTFKATVPFKEGAFLCDVFDADRNPADLGAMDTKGARVTAIIQCTGVWFAGGKFGVSWKVVQMKVAQNNTKLSGYALMDMDDDDAAAAGSGDDFAGAADAPAEDSCSEGDASAATAAAPPAASAQPRRKPAARPLTAPAPVPAPPAPAAADGGDGAAAAEAAATAMKFM